MGHSAGCFLQTCAWGRVRRRYGWQAHRLALVGPSGTRVGAQVLLRRTRAGALAYVPRGPVCDPRGGDWPAVLGALRDWAAPRCVALRLEPHWPDAAASRDLLAGAGLREVEAVQPRSTLRLSLDGAEDQLLAAMKQKCRYNIRLSARNGVTVRAGTSADLPLFERLMDETAARDAFPRRGPGYYAAVWHELGPTMARLYVAHLGERPLAAVLVVHCGRTATYLYGASSGEERQRMPNHALQWAAIRQAKAEGCREYDLWGVPDAVGRAAQAGTAPDAVRAGSGGLWGVWGFKRGFGGRVWRSAGAWDDVYRPARYHLGTRVRPLIGRWLLRRSS